MQSMIDIDKAVKTKRLYRSDPERFGVDLFGDFYWSKQREIFQAIRDGKKRFAIKAAHAVSKSFTCGRIAIWSTVCHKPVLTFTTAPTHRQVNEVLWKEIRTGWSQSKVALSQKQPLPRSPEWTISSNQRAFGASSDKPERLQGLHEGLGHVCSIVDEAGGIEGNIWPALFAIVTGQDDMLFLVGNPDTRNPDFMRCFSDPSFHSMTIGAHDSPNFTGEDVPDHIKKALVSREWVDGLIKAYGIDSPIVRSKVFAEFPDTDNQSLIPLWMIEAAENRDFKENPHIRRAGMDVARYGSDRTVAYSIKGNQADLLFEYGKKDLMETAGYAVQVICSGLDLSLDDTGLGGGVTDRLREQDLYPSAVTFGAKCFEEDDQNRFFDNRGLMFWKLREWIKDEGRIPNDPSLRAELIDIRYQVLSNGRIKIESKDEYRKRAQKNTGRAKSPDKADALALAVAGHLCGKRTANIEEDFLDFAPSLSEQYAI